MTICEWIDQLRRYPQTAVVDFRHVRNGDKVFVMSDIEGNEEPSKENCTQVTVWLAPS